MKKTILLLLFIPMIFSCGLDQENKKEKNNLMPIAKKIPQKNIYHSDTIIDNYDWMRLSDSQKESNQDIQTKNVSEDTKPVPKDRYSRLKLRCEKLLRTKSKKQKILILRLSNIIGVPKVISKGYQKLFIADICQSAFKKKKNYT